MSFVLQASNLAVGRGQYPVLTGVSFGVEPGERLALVGANGTGKSTLLRALAGLDPVMAGTIHYSGGNLPAGRARVRTLGVLFQTETPSRFTVRELLTLGLGADGPHRPPIRLGSTKSSSAPSSQRSPNVRARRCPAAKCSARC